MKKIKDATNRYNEFRKKRKISSLFLELGNQQNIHIYA